MTMPSPQGQRLQPALPSRGYKTFQIIAPLKTHFRAATCEEVECAAYVNGFRLFADEAAELGQAQAAYVRRECGRKFTEDRDAAGLTVFTFPPGTKPFASDEHTSHKVRLEREEVFLTHPGDWRWRPNAGERHYRHTRSEFWTEEFAEHQQNLADRIERG